MAENWEIRGLERRIDSLERDLERERKRTEDEKRQAQEKKWRRSERRNDVAMAVFLTLYVAAMTTYIVLAATGHLHHH